DTIRYALRLDDADGIDCLPNEDIFAELARMGYEKPRHPNRGKIIELDADGDVTLVNVDADTQGRMEEDVTAVKDINVFESKPTVFDDEESIQIIAIKFLEHVFKTLECLCDSTKSNYSPITYSKYLLEDVIVVMDINVVESEPTFFDDEEEKEDLERAKVLQQQYDQKQEDIDWNIITEQMQEKHLENVKKYQSLKRKPIFVAQAKKNMKVYLKHIAGYKIQHFKGMTYDQVRPIFEREYKHVQTFLKSDKDGEPSKKRIAKETLLQESFKKPRAEVEVLGSHSTQEETPTIDRAKISQEDIQNMLQVIPMAEFKVEALQVKYPLIYWEIYSEGSKTY
nr:hypothetical protein [Tanacetum cinerariifolium]